MYESNKLLASGLGALARSYLVSGDADPTGGMELEPPFTSIGQREWSRAVQLWNAQGSHFIKAMKPRACPACGLDERRDIFTSYDGYPYSECLSCGCWYVPLMVEAKVFDDFFDVCPAARELSKTTFEQRKTPEFEASSIERIGAYLDNLLLLLLRKSGDIRYLDIGCGLGYSLKAAKARGMLPMGTESSLECLAIAQGEGLNVRPASDPLVGNVFDLITFWESLEHIADPLEVLLECANMLSAEGLLAFTVPNQNSPMVRVQRADCFVVHGGYDTPGHINLFSPSTLEMLLSRAGFSLLYVDGQYGMNVGELASYLNGNNRGAFDLLNDQLGRQGRLGLSQVAQVTWQATGPVISLLERVLLASPILYCVACRKGNEGKFSENIAMISARRDAELLRQAAAYEGDGSQALTDANMRIEALEKELAIANSGLLQRLGIFFRGALNSSKD